MIKTSLLAAFAALSLTVAAPMVSADDAADTTFSAQGDAQKGKRVFNRCKSCHILTKEGGKRLGPSLAGLFGRSSGTMEGYKYSKALAEADFVWTEAQLNNWLSNPKTFLPGNKMNFIGLRKEKDRNDLMAFLRQATVAE